MAFINLSAPDVLRKLPRLERIGEKNLQNLVVMAEKVFNNWEHAEKKQVRSEK